MNKKQPEAMIFADAIDPFTRKLAPDHITSKAAADELRRLHSLNAELLDTLKSIDDRLRKYSGLPISADEAYDTFYQDVVAEVIAKAEAKK